MTQTPETAAITEDHSGSGLTGGDPQKAGGGDIIPFVSIPQVGAYRTEDHRYYMNGKGPVPSVTTILKVMDKPAVVQWAKRTVAEIATRRVEELMARIVDQGAEEAIRWLASLPDYQRDQAGKLGTSIHLLADMAARYPENAVAAFEMSEQEKPYLEAFRTFLGHLRGSGGEIVSSEKMVWSSAGYAGTYDLLLRWQGELWLVDIKTSKGYYPEYALQLVAYGYADGIILEGNPDLYPMPSIQRYGVLHLRPDQYPDTGFRFVEYIGVGDTDYRAFLGALELHSWKTKGRYTRKILSGGIQNLKTPSDTGNPFA